MSDNQNKPVTREDFYAVQESRHGKELQKMMANTTVAICGLGGLGSNIAICLARMGIGRLILIDFDNVDISNLHRQQYKLSQVGLPKPAALANNLGEINPYIQFETHHVKITEENLHTLLEKADIICEAFDNPTAKAMLVEGVLTNFPDKYLVAASGMAGAGKANDIKTRRISKHFYICGDGVSEVSTEECLFASRVMLCAAHQAHKVMEIIKKNIDE